MRDEIGHVIDKAKKLLDFFGGGKGIEEILKSSGNVRLKRVLAFMHMQSMMPLDWIISANWERSWW